MGLGHFSPSYMCMRMCRAGGNLLRFGEVEYVSPIVFCTHCAGQTHAFSVPAFHGSLGSTIRSIPYGRRHVGLRLAFARSSILLYHRNSTYIILCLILRK